MKRVKSRATSALLLALGVLLGIGVYLWRYVSQGEKWVMYRANRDLYTDGLLTSATLTDRNGLLLAKSENGVYYYAGDASTRIACLHAVGDFSGNIGTGAVTAFAAKLAGYNPVTGVRSAGKPLNLTLDAKLNRAAYSALAGRRGAVLLMNYSTGEVLCMVSSPSYDPNTGFNASDPTYEGVWLNRCLSSAYTPGSVFKLVTVAAALEKLDGVENRTFSCPGSVEIGGETVTCSGVHGEQTLSQALANSCNCAFAELSVDLGGETLESYAKKLGFCDSQSLSGIDSSAGSFSAAPAGSADLAWSGIGQYTDLVCPFAMLRYAAAIANGGKLVTPKLIPGGLGGSKRLLNQETAEKIRELMLNNVASSYGSWNFPGLALGAKTGTAEVGGGSSHAWFTGFLDDADHPYAFCVVIEHGGGGLSAAGPVANAVLQAAVS